MPATTPAKANRLVIGTITALLCLLAFENRNSLSRHYCKGNCMIRESITATMALSAIAGFRVVAAPIAGADSTCANCKAAANDGLYNSWETSK